MHETKAPERIAAFKGHSVFLAGSIEMGKAPNWQTRVIEELDDLECHIMNPRRDDWDNSWTQDVKNSQFMEQVKWELKYADIVQTVFFYFDPGTMSPISLMELGLQAKSNANGDFDRIVVCCPKDYWRRGNVEAVCLKYRISLWDDLPDAILDLRARIKMEGTALYPWGVK